MKNIHLLYNTFILSLVLLMLSSCGEGEGDFAPGIIGVFITGAFVIGVLFYFLFRSQHKRKGDNNRKP